VSCCRENVIWQSADGTWNRGFYAYWQTNTDDEDRDEEWDVDYSWDEFNWVRTGLASEQDAVEAWRGVNPGMREVLPWSERASKQCAELDTLAVACLAEHGQGR